MTVSTLMTMKVMLTQEIWLKTIYTSYWSRNSKFQTNSHSSFTVFIKTSNEMSSSSSNLSITYCLNRSATKVLVPFHLSTTQEVTKATNIWMTRGPETPLSWSWRRNTTISESCASRTANASLVPTQFCRFLLRKLYKRLRVLVKNYETSPKMIFCCGSKIMMTLWVTMKRTAKIWMSSITASMASIWI